jgi:beta-aspartyl-peptidase (threonine type)
VERTHVTLVNQGALHFVALCGVGRASDNYWDSVEHMVQLQSTKRNGNSVLGYDTIAHDDSKYPTVGAVTYDILGGITFGTSTDGIVDKRFGRVGDTSIIDAGVYAYNTGCVITCAA